MRVYEELFIVKPDAPEEEVESFIEQMKQVITTGKGTVDKVDNWGIRKLAYRMSKYTKALHPGSVHRAAGTGEGSRAPYARGRHGDQVHHRAHRREAEENRQAQEGARKAGGAQACAAGRRAALPVPAVPLRRPGLRPARPSLRLPRRRSGSRGNTETAATRRTKAAE